MPFLVSSFYRYEIENELKYLFHVAERAEPDEDLDVFCLGLLLEGVLSPEVSRGAQLWIFLEDDVAEGWIVQHAWGVNVDLKKLSPEIEKNNIRAIDIGDFVVLRLEWLVFRLWVHINYLDRLWVFLWIRHRKKSVIKIKFLLFIRFLLLSLCFSRLRWFWMLWILLTLLWM